MRGQLPADAPAPHDHGGVVHASLVDYVDELVGTIPGPEGHFVRGCGTHFGVLAGVVARECGGRLRAARWVAARLGYAVVDLRDPGSGQHYTVVRERLPARLGWGTYVVNRAPACPDVQVQVPHPLHDRHTPRFGVEAFQRLDAAVLMIAGVSRYANLPAQGRGRRGVVESDMARNEASLFMAVHRCFAARGGWTLQYHGFGGRAHYPDIVLSNGTHRPDAGLPALRAELGLRGLHAGVFDGSAWHDLAATRNPQGRHARGVGARFVHMEHKPAVRGDPASRQAAVDALHAVRHRVEAAQRADPGHTTLL